jgi:Na+/melibiose symporter-like transporter
VFKRWLLFPLLLLIGLGNLVRAGMIGYVAPVIDDQMLSVSWGFLGAFYLAWGITFVVLAGMAWRRRHRTHTWTLPVALGYQASVWLLRLLAERSPYARSLWRRDLLLSALFVLLIAWSSSNVQKREAPSPDTSSHSS